MPHFIAFFVMPLLGYLGGIWFTSAILHDMYRTAVGYDIAQLGKLKAECEAELPRNKVCISSVVFTPGIPERK